MSHETSMDAAQAREAAQSLKIIGREGHASFINGQYDLQDEVLNGKPVYMSNQTIPSGYGQASGSHVYLYYHAENDAWVLSQELASLDVLAYAPTHIKNIWSVNTGHGPFVPDPKVKLLTAINNQVLTNLGAWAVDPTAEVALKVTKEGPGSEAPLTLNDLFVNTCRRYESVRALAEVDQSSGTWKFWTYRQYLDDVSLVSKAFIHLGLQPHHGVVLIGANAPQWSIASIAASVSGSFSCGMYPNSTAQTIQYVAENTKANIIVVDNEEQYSKIRRIRDQLPYLRAVVMYKGHPKDVSQSTLGWDDLIRLGKDITPDSREGREFADRQRNLRANKCCSVVYTSGTSGTPKGVMLSHDNITWTSRAIASFVESPPAQEQILSFLPLGHIAAQLFEVYLPITVAGTVYFPKQDILSKHLVETLQTIRPTVFFAVPAIWEKLQHHVNEAYLQKSNGKEKSIASWARKRGMLGSIKQQRGESVDFKFKMANKMVFSKIKAGLGLDRCRVCLNGASSFPRNLFEFFLSVNIPIYDFYGLAESCGPHVVSVPGTLRAGSCGKTYPGTQIRLITGSNEIILFGRNIFMGYLNDSASTAEAVDDRGWLHTGDIGLVDRAGYLYVTGRMRDLVITAGGDNILPVPLEQKILDEMPFLSNAMIIGDKRKYLSALVSLKTLVDTQGAPTDELAPEAVGWLSAEGINASTVSALLRSPGPFLDLLKKGIGRVNDRAVSEAHKIIKFEVLPVDFSLVGGELGPTFRVQRLVVAKKYEGLINKMYGGQAEDFSQAPWYHGPISRQDTEKLLVRDGAVDGWFLVRQSTKEKNVFVISLCFKGRLFHNQITYKDGKYNTGKEQGNHQYDSLFELVEHHSHGANGFQTKLTFAAKKF